MRQEEEAAETQIQGAAEGQADPALAAAAAAAAVAVVASADNIGNTQHNSGNRHRQHMDLIRNTQRTAHYSRVGFQQCC